jgi:methionyl-tRNA synthetase
VALLVSPVIPATADRIGEQLGLGPFREPRLEAARTWGVLPAGTQVRRAPPMFPRLEKVPEAEEFV